MSESWPREDPAWKKFEKRVYNNLTERRANDDIELIGGSNSVSSDVRVNDSFIECKLGNGAKAAPFIVTNRDNEHDYLSIKYTPTNKEIQQELLDAINMSMPDRDISAIVDGTTRSYYRIPYDDSDSLAKYVKEYYTHSKRKPVSYFATTDSNSNIVYVDINNLADNFKFQAYFHRHQSGSNYVNYYWEYTKQKKNRDIRDSLIRIFNLNGNERNFFDLESNYVSDSNKIYYKSYIDVSKSRKSLRNVWFIPNMLLIDSKYPDIIELYQIDDRGRDLFLRKCSLEHELYTSKEGFTGYSLMARSNTASMEVYIYMKYTGNGEYITSADELIL